MPFLAFEVLIGANGLHKWEQNVHTTDRYPYGNPTYRLTTWNNVLSNSMLSPYVAFGKFPCTTFPSGIPPLTPFYQLRRLALGEMRLTPFNNKNIQNRNTFAYYSWRHII